MKKILYIDIALIEPEFSDWEGWLDSEVKNVRRRFGNDEESMRLWPDNYYQLLESWWKTPRRDIDPIELTKDDNGLFRIVDGWHRLAISHKIGLRKVPAVVIS